MKDPESSSTLFHGISYDVLIITEDEGSIGSLLLEERFKLRSHFGVVNEAVVRST